MPVAFRVMRSGWCISALLWGGAPPLLPACKSFVFIDLLFVLVCKIFITNGLRPKYCKEMGYGLEFPSIESPGRGPGLFFSSLI